MNLDKAIEIQTLTGTPEFEAHTEDILAARKLGIEAMKRIVTWRKGLRPSTFKLLPGETKE